MDKGYQDPPKSKRAKDTFYFSHDVNAFLDPKIRVLVYEFGISAYGAFWLIVEMLASDSNHRIRHADLYRAIYPLLRGRHVRAEEDGGGHMTYTDDTGVLVLAEEAGLLNILPSTASRLLERMIEVDLFYVEDGWLRSRSLDARMQMRDAERTKKAAAGAIGGRAKARKIEELRMEECHSSDASKPLAPASPVLSKERKEKERKEKERKIYIEAAPHVRMTQPELDVIKNEHGEAWANQFIKAVSDYQASTGKRYKDFPATARTWKAREIQRANSAPISRPPGERPPMNIDLDAVVDPFQSLKDRENEKKSKLEALQNRRH